MVLVGLAVFVAWLIRFGCDDAFIAFQYARSLVRGDGLNWFGDYVEGYTSFAWVLWIAAGLALDVEPLVWAWAGSLAALAAALVLAYRVAELRTASRIAALCTLGLLATNFTFLAFGTSGLETMLQCALLLAATYEVERVRRSESTSRTRLATLSVVGALALWTRLDSAIVLAVLGSALLYHFVRTRAPRGAYAALLAPGALLVAGWLAWKLYYYGDVLPNTFAAKVAVSSASVGNGARFVLAFLHAYLVWPLLAIVAIASVLRRRFTAVLPTFVVIAWCAYVVYVGGDFMEFRFFVPVMPHLFLMISETITAEARARWLPAPWLRAAALVGLLATVSWRHAATFRATADRAYDSVYALRTYYELVPDGDWPRLGRPLRDALAGSAASIACNGAGAIPYYADLPTIDQLGLNDRWVARYGAQFPASYARPGHQRFATYEYLVARRVTFVIGSPQVVPRGALSARVLPVSVVHWLRTVLGPTTMPSGSILVVAAPIDERRALLLWYLTPTPDITERVQHAGWEMRDVVKR